MFLNAFKTTSAMSALCAVLLPLPATSQDALAPEDAQAAAQEAYVFTYPLVMMYRTMYLQAIDETSPSYAGGFGEWYHLGMSTPDDHDIVTPNNDTPYSYAWVDLRAEPWVLTVPEIEEGRFYTSQWDDLWGYVLDNVGSSKDGNGGTSVLLAAPGWEGELPEGLDRVVHGESQFLGSLTRTQAYSLDDMDNVRAIQEQYDLQPLSAWLDEDAPAPAPQIDWRPWEEGDETTLKYWQYVSDMLPFVEPHPQDADAYETLAALGIKRGEDFDPSALSPEIRDAMQAGINAARAQLTDWGNNITDAKLFFNSREVVGDDYQSRATGVFAGIFGNTGEISVYLSIATDAEGELLDGSENSYTLTFADGELPPVEFFWSATMYQLPTRWLVENPIDRYSIGSATAGVQTAEDGSLTLYIGAESPGEELESNWLPAPDGPFWMVLRNYGPDESIIDGSYQVPPVTPVD